MHTLGEQWVEVIDGQEHMDLIKDVAPFLEWVDKNYYTKIVLTRAQTDGLNGYGKLIKYYVEFYIICERCRKCGWIPVIHGGDEEGYEYSCKGRHAWDKCYELLLASGDGLSEKEAIKNATIYPDSIPISWRKEHFSGIQALPVQKQFLTPEEHLAYHERLHTKQQAIDAWNRR